MATKKRKGIRFIQIATVLLLLFLLFFSLLSCQASEPFSLSSAQPAPIQLTEPLIQSGKTVWKYLDDDKKADSLSSWTYTSYSDTNWKSAAGSFGAKQGELAELSGGYLPQNLLKQYLEDGSTSIPTYYFRTSFTLSDVSQVGSLKGKIVFDDAVIIYINGIRVYQDNTPEQGYSSNLHYGAAEAYGAPLSREFEIRDVSMLQNGENVVAVELHQAEASSTDIYFDFTSLEVSTESFSLPSETLSGLNPILTVGPDETSLAISWVSREKAEYQVWLMKDEDISPLGIPMQHRAYTPAYEKAVDSDLYTYSVTLKELSPGVQYAYCIVLNHAKTDYWPITTPNTSSDFRFLFAGDPQLISEDDKSWSDTLSYASTAFSDVAFLLSAGDQVDVADDPSLFQTFVEPSILRSLPLVVNQGNHEADSPFFDSYFPMPNQDEETGDYFFTYQDALMVSLNSNNTHYASHQAFLTHALEAYRNAKDEEPRWFIVTQHHSIYSAGPHGDGESMVSMRTALAPVFSQLDVDLVLMGHDHTYTRTFLMENDKPVYLSGSGQPYPSAKKEAGQVLYLTANSSTGSKFYDLQDTQPEFAAIVNQTNTPQLTCVDVTGNALQITTYEVETGNLIDRFTLYQQ